MVVLESTPVLLEAEALEGAAPAEAFDEMGGVFDCEDISSIGSSLTGVASPLSSEWCEASPSSPVFLFIFFDLMSLELDLFPVEDDVGK